LGADHELRVSFNVHQTTSATRRARHERKEERRKCNGNSIGKKATDNARSRGLQGERRAQERRAERGLVEDRDIPVGMQLASSGPTTLSFVLNVKFKE
jgi:hypothetical protein